MPYPAKWNEAPPFLSPRKTPYKDVKAQSLWTAGYGINYDKGK